MKISLIKNLTLAIALLLGVVTVATASIVPFSSAYGNGNVTQTSYGETADIDHTFGLSTPVVSYSTWPGGTTYNWQITVDTDYGKGYFYVGDTDEPIPVSIEVHIF